LKTYVIEWREKFFARDIKRKWTTLEGEEWLPESAAQERLKYWQGLSLSKLLEFRVVEKLLVSGTVKTE
jgi:hypothetical protein